MFAEPPVGAAEWADWFDRDPDARATMAFAQRASLTFTEAEARLRWQMDRDAEQGWAIYKARDSILRCSGCGVHPSEVHSSDGRIADEPYWKIQVNDCPICEAREEIEEEMRKGDNPPKGRRVVVVPRQRGEELAPDLY